MGSGYMVMVKGLPLISLSLTRIWSLCWPRLHAVYDTSYREGEVTATAACIARGSLVGLVGMVLVMSSSSAVTFCWSEHGLPLESLSSTRTCVGWLAVADCRPGPLTWHV